MRICFLMLSHWSGNLGGAEIQVRYLMDYLLRHTRHDLTMICRYTSMTSENGVPIHRTQPIQPFGRYFKAADYLSVRRLLRQLSPDVVYTRVSSPFVGFATQYCRQFSRKLIYHIAHIEDVTPFRAKAMKYLPKKLERPLFEYGLRRADAVIGQAAYQAELLERHYHRSCAAIIPNFHPAPATLVERKERHTVLWVANIKAGKRPELFVELAKRCAHLSMFHFEMIGAVQNADYNALIADTSGMMNFKYLGKLDLEEVNRRMERAYLFVNTSRASGEGFPNTFIQAWLRGVPVASLEANPDNILTDQEAGICANDSFDMLVEQVTALLRDPARSETLGQNARRFALERYGIDNCRRIVEIIERQ